MLNLNKKKNTTDVRFFQPNFFFYIKVEIALIQNCYISPERGRMIQINNYKYFGACFRKPGCRVPRFRMT